MFTRTDAQEPHHHADLHHRPAAHSRAHRHAPRVNDHFHERDRLRPDPISARQSTSNWGNTRLRVALVLDNTGSMADDGKMTALKTATNNLLTQLKSARQPDRRRLRLDRPVHQGRERRHRQLQRSPGSLGSVGSGQRHLQQVASYTDADRTCQIARRDLDAGQPQHLERLRHRPRPELRHHQRRAGRRRARCSRPSSTTPARRR